MTDRSVPPPYDPGCPLPVSGGARRVPCMPVADADGTARTNAPGPGVAAWVSRRRLFHNRPRRIVLVGDMEMVTRLVARLRARADRYRVVGQFSCQQGAGEWRCDGDVSDLLAFCHASLPDMIVLALEDMERQRMRDLLARLIILPTELRLAMDILPPGFIGDDFNADFGMCLLPVCQRPLDGWRDIIKLAEDKIISLLALVMLAPLFLVIALLIRIDSHGPVFFRQKRYGFNNEIINILKFRTMYTDQEDLSGRQMTVRGDQRVTRVGRYLRNLSLDELPQLVNVLMGQMSIVGPRAHAVAMEVCGRPYEHVVEGYSARHRVRPGITGLAQVNGSRGPLTTVEAARRRVEYDLTYVAHWSLWLDIRIIIKSVWIVFFRRENAF